MGEEQAERIAAVTDTMEKPYVAIYKEEGRIVARIYEKGKQKGEEYRWPEEATEFEVIQDIEATTGLARAEKGAADEESLITVLI